MTLKVTMVGGPTAVLEIGGLRVITDPTFDPPQTYPGDPEAGIPVITKTVGPALGVDEVGPVDVALVSHDHHIDNLDQSGRAFLAGVGSVFTTSAGAERLGGGAVGLEPYGSATVRRPGGGELTITGVPARHGPDGLWQLVGPVIGFVLSGDGLPTVYVSGDNSSLEVVGEVADKIGEIDVAVLFCGGAKFDEILDGAYLTLSNDDAVRAAELLGSATVIPVHADGWAHFSQSPAQLRAAYEAAGIGDRLVVVRPGATADLDASVSSAPSD
ncbi:MAG TPA: MBL fold metallo-hydrolase [Pseudonocardia sp.]|jgi:L-ascorbate metabolism protein UlaG (beta-lactamase superfamily)|nr:MBL fold metallo-hydrolase [Pseudonocardia sp.]